MSNTCRTHYARYSTSRLGVKKSSSVRICTHCNIKTPSLFYFIFFCISGWWTAKSWLLLWRTAMHFRYHHCRQPHAVPTVVNHLLWVPVQWLTGIIEVNLTIPTAIKPANRQQYDWRRWWQFAITVTPSWQDVELRSLHTHRHKHTHSHILTYTHTRARARTQRQMHTHTHIQTRERD